MLYNASGGLLLFDLDPPFEILRQDSAGPRCGEGCEMMDLHQPGTELGSPVFTFSVTDCAISCQALTQCNNWRWLSLAFSGQGWESPGDCYLMSDQTGVPFSSPNTISGTRDCLPGVTSSSTTGSWGCESHNMQTQGTLVGPPKQAATETLCAFTCLHVSGCNHWRWHNQQFQGRTLPGPRTSLSN